MKVVQHAVYAVGSLVGSAGHLVRFSKKPAKNPCRDAGAQYGPVHELARNLSSAEAVGLENSLK